VNTRGWLLYRYFGWWLDYTEVGIRTAFRLGVVMAVLLLAVSAASVLMRQPRLDDGTQKALIYDLLYETQTAVSFTDTLEELLTGPGVLDPLSTVIVEIYFVAAESTLPGSTTDYAEVNDAKALDLEYYVDGSDDDDVIIMDADMSVDKELTEPPSGYTDIGETVIFTVTITNEGDLPILTVPLVDTYDPAKLGYVTASPTPDTADTVGGVLEWTDLTGPGSLAPGGALIVEMTFEALEYTDYGGTEDLAEVIDAYVAQDKYLSGSDTASVVILSPVGGEVALTPLQAASPYLAAALVLASTLALKRRIGSL
jgi:uncharacterized repeat protein (TIGR01451 family)